jgi:hypothetical protein
MSHAMSKLPATTDEQMKGMKGACLAGWPIDTGKDLGRSLARTSLKKLVSTTSLLVLPQDMRKPSRCDAKAADRWKLSPLKKKKNTITYLPHTNSNTVIRPLSRQWIFAPLKRIHMCLGS